MAFSASGLAVSLKRLKSIKVSYHSININVKLSDLFCILLIEKQFSTDRNILSRTYLNNSTIDGAAIADAFFKGVRDNHLLHFISIKKPFFISRLNSFFDNLR